MPASDDKQFRMTITVNVDMEALAEHDGDKKPPPNDLRDWYGGDLEAALDAGIIEIEHSPIEDIEEVTG